MNIYEMADADVLIVKRRKRKSTVTDSAKKRRKVAYKTSFDKTRVNIGTNFERWRLLKTRLSAKSDAKLAQILLDRYDDAEARIKTSTPGPGQIDICRAPSTPGPSASAMVKRLHPLLNLPVSEISSASEKDQPIMSGIETLQTGDNSSGSSDAKTRTLAVTTKAGRKVEGNKLTSSFVDPFDVSIDITLHESEYEGFGDDPDYEPSFVLSTNVSDIDSDADYAYEEIEFGLEIDTNTVDEENAEETIDTPGVTKITTDSHCDDLSNSTLCLAFLPQLKLLANISVSKCITVGCREEVSLKESFVGSALYLRWVCSNDHISQVWCSQPVLNKRLHSGDFLVSGSILTSGNNYGKLCLWAKMLNLKFPSADQFHRIQSRYLVPTIDQYWEELQNDMMNSLQGKQIVVLGDGRNDSPGYCSQYCSYTLMENSTKRILTLQTLDKRVTDRKSVNMEKVGFKRAMDYLADKGVDVIEVVTDAHLGIGAMMKSDYPGMKHSHDIWHVAKNLGKKIVKVGQKKQNSVLLKWSRDIVNHFWFSCKQANNCSEFVSIWRSVLHHITNQHTWMLPGDDNRTGCLHGPLSEDEERDKPWLNPQTDALVLKDLASIVMDHRLLNKVSYYLNFRSTAELEGFHQHILMYCAKRFAYSPPVYRCRNLLAAIDHNKNLDRDFILNKDGMQRLQRSYNKKSGRWTAHPKKVPKQYNYMTEILNMALKMRLLDKVGMRRKKVLEDQDPRRIAAHLAPVEPKPTKELMAEKVSRFT